MAVIYDPGGTKVNTTISATDKTTLCDNIKAQAVIAGFSVTSGASGDWVLTCAATASGSYSAQCRLFTGTNGVKVQLRNNAVTASSSSEVCIFPQTGKSYRIWANKHQWICWEEGVTTAGTWAMWCQPFVPSHLLATTTETAFACSNGGNDGAGIGGTISVSPRNSYVCSNRAQLYNGVIQSGLGGAGDRINLPRFGSDVHNFPYDWANNDKILYDAVVAYNVAGADSKWQGYIWEAFITGGPFNAEKITTDDVPGFTGIKGRCVTDNKTDLALWILDNP